MSIYICKWRQCTILDVCKDKTFRFYVDVNYNVQLKKVINTTPRCRVKWEFVKWRGVILSSTQ